MKRLLAILLGFFLLTSITSNLNAQNTDDYKNQWEKVDKFISKSLPKSALKVIDDIYKDAQQSTNQDQILKCDIYYFKTKQLFEEDYFETLITKMENDLKTAPYQNAAMMHSMLGQLYWQYYYSNSWEINNRTEISNFTPEDLKTWTTENLVAKSIEHYNLSLENADKLKDKPSKFYSEMINDGSKPKNLRPTIYDFLAARAVEFFSNPEASITRPADYFQIQDDIYYSDIATFANAKIKSTDTLSLHYHGIKILQNWLKFRINDAGNNEALVAADLIRLAYVNNFSVAVNKEDLYLKALKQIVDKNPNVQQTGYAQLEIAKFYYEKASKYNHKNPSTIIYKPYYTIAKNLLEGIIVTYNKLDEVKGQAKSILVKISHKDLQYSNELVYLPNKTFPIFLKYKNIKEVYVEVRQINNFDYKKILKKSFDTKKQISKIRQVAKLNKTYTFKLKTKDDFQYHSTELLLDGLPSGGYIILISNSPEFENSKSLVDYNFVQVSNIGLIHQTLSNGSLECYVVSRDNSEPKVNAKIHAYYEKYNYRKNKYVRKNYGTYKTDENGYTVIPAKNNDWTTLSFTISTQNDSLIINNVASIYKQQIVYPKTVNTVSIFTDRKLYRPGQTVYFKGLAIAKTGKERELLTNESVNVTFYDVNYQKITSQVFITNEFGTFNGSFAIPLGLLNGSMNLTTSYGSTNIQVEEYKRPSFEIEVKNPSEQYIVNQEVSIKGHAKNYSGANLSDAQVKYTIVRKNVWYGWRWWNFSTEEVLISRGVSKTDDKGEFEISFEAIPDLSMPRNQNSAFNYTISVDVTDLNGETQSTSKTVIVGYTAMKIFTDFPSKISKIGLKDKQNINISAVNLNLENVDANGTIEVFSLQTPDNSLNKRYWDYPDEPLYTKNEWYTKYPGNEYLEESDFRFWKKDKNVWKTNFDTKVDKKINIKGLKKLKAGVYKIVIKSKDAFDKNIESVEFFEIFKEKGNTIPYPTNDWIVNLTPSVEVGNNAKFIVGSSDKTRAIVQISMENEMLKRQIIDLENEQKLIEYPVTEEMRGGFIVSVVSICKNRTYKKNFFVNVPYTNKKLDIEFITFRDKLQPGQKEQFKIVIKDKKDNPEVSELLAFMYDASLDALYPYNFDYSLYQLNYSSFNWAVQTFGNDNSNSYNSIDYPHIKYNSLYYSSLNWFGFYYHQPYLYSENVKYSKSRVYAVPKYKNGEKDYADDGAVDELEDKEQNIKSDSKDITVNQAEKKEVQIRQNFNETAFFYPDLLTDTAGNLVISFTMPESLTKWKFLGLAHTKDLKIGMFEKYVVTQKELMVMPNAPRFFRQGDTMFFAAKISNLSDKNLSGNVTLEFIDEITGKAIDNIVVSKEKQKFSVDKGLNTPAKWKIIIPEDAKLLTYRIIAKAGNFSDGEQKAIPVMTNRILVTEALPLPIRANETKEFKFIKLINSGNSKTIKTDKLTVEFTSNPAWYAVQALPYLIEYPYECSEQTFARLYANTLASYIANSSPKIKAVFDTWKNFQPSALMSNLEKNQELKSVLLEETPWVLDAQDENERKHRIALLFDLNTMANKQQKALKKLKKEQSVNGGWSWFPGMPESWWITQYIAEGIGHLMKLNVVSESDADFYNMATKAVKFTDYKMNKYYKYLKKHYTAKEMKTLQASQLIIHYFYTRSFYDIPLANKYQPAYDYFYGQMKKYWTNNSLYSQGMLALIFDRFDDKKLAQLLVQSFTERAIYHEELGMYWKENIAGYYWYQAPIQTQALMIEVFDEVAKSPKDVDELKIWLLKNKQTNDWKTTTATAKAIYSLLLTGGVDMLANSTICPVTIGNKLIDPANNPDIQAEAGTGYYKVSFGGNEVTPNMGNIKVVNNNNIVAWGAVYWQYFEDLDKITPHETPLKLKKDLYKEITTDRGAQLVKLNNKDILKLGDKVIVRIELRVDRDMEFVHMKDMRAAAFEPINVISRYKWQDGLGYYETTKDASTNFFFDHLRKGTYVFEYPLRVSAEGSFSNGITTIQCMYAPEFMSHSKGQRVKIKN